MKLTTKEVIGIGVPYLIATGACYMLGYWGAFNINPLEFLSFADLAKLAVYPLVAYLMVMLAGVLSAQIVYAPIFPPGGGNESRVGLFGKKYWRWLILLHIAIIVLVAMFAPEPGRWFLVAFLVAPLSVPLTHDENVIELVPNPQARSVTLFLLLLLPFLSFAYGRQQAFLVKNGAAEQILDVARSKLSLASDEKKSGRISRLAWRCLRPA